MKIILAALSALVAWTAIAGPAAAQTAIYNEGAYVQVQEDGLSGPLPGPWHPRYFGSEDRGRFAPPRDGGVNRGDGWDQGGRRDDILPERRIVRRVLREGFVRIDDVELRRDRYIVRAIRPNGSVMRLAVDAYDGEILARERIGWAPDNRRYHQDRFDDNRRPSSGIEFDLGTGRVNLYGQ